MVQRNDLQYKQTRGKQPKREQNKSLEDEIEEKEDERFSLQCKRFKFLIGYRKRFR